MASEMKLIQPIVVHLRLGDYLSLGKIYGNPSPGFFDRAISLLAHKESPIWIFTQSKKDIDSKLLRHFKYYKIIDETLVSEPAENLVLMSMGAGLICSNSTFSWWAAFLQSRGEKVVAPFHVGKKNVFTSSMVLESWNILNVREN